MTIIGNSIKSVRSLVLALGILSGSLFVACGDDGTAGPGPGTPDAGPGTDASTGDSGEEPGPTCDLAFDNARVPGFPDNIPSPLAN